MNAARRLRYHVGTKAYAQLAFKGDHVGGYVSGRAKREGPPAIHEWLAMRTK